MKDHQESGHTRPISDPHKEIPTKTHSNMMNKNPPKIPMKITEKEKCREQRIWHEIETEDFTMNILAKYGYKILTRNTNLGWQKAQTKSHTPTFPLSPRAPQNERALPPLAKELAENSAPLLLYTGPPEKTEVPLL
jgi:hypothetical protein